MQNYSLCNCIFLIDKPPEITSFDTIKAMKRILGIKKIGHSGTLDKYASGLLIVCTGMATKLTRYFLEDSKRYRGVVRLGISTDTDDRSGRVIDEKSLKGITEEDIRASVNRFTGVISQRPPHYSALKINGERASDIARKGGALALKERRVTVSRFEVYDIDVPRGRFSVDVECSKGTYIRSLARDIGSDLNTGAYLEELRRISSGIFSVDDAATLEELKGYCDGLAVQKRFILTPREALRNFSSLVVRNQANRRIFNGASFQRSDVLSMSHGGIKTFIIYDEEENVIAIAEIDIEKWHISYLNIFHNEPTEN